MNLGREFLGIFENWASGYDRSVAGLDPQYAQVFENYETILNEVAHQSSGTVLEFGVGTGNLSAKLMEMGHHVIGVEPSRAMRKIAMGKFPEFNVLDGDFITYPPISESINTIASTYAFHHLTDEEKEKAIRHFAEVLPKNGKIVFGDTMFQSEEAKKEMIKEAKKAHFTDLADDLHREYYPTLDTIASLLEMNGFDASFKQMNPFVWVVTATKKNSQNE